MVTSGVVCSDAFLRGGGGAAEERRNRYHHRLRNNNAAALPLLLIMMLLSSTIASPSYSLYYSKQPSAAHPLLPDCQPQGVVSMAPGPHP